MLLHLVNLHLSTLFSEIIILNPKFDNISLLLLVLDRLTGITFVPDDN